MKEVLRQRAQELGFDDCRVTGAHAPESAARFHQWLAEGRQGQMVWLARNAAKRVDPQQVLAGARSIITLAVSYYDPGCASWTQRIHARRRRGRRSTSGRRRREEVIANRRLPIANTVASPAMPAMPIIMMCSASA